MKETKQTGLDRQLISRLLSYTDGYKKYIAISLVLLIFVIGIDLARPFLVGIAVDDVISNYDKVIEEEIDGKTYISTLILDEDGHHYYLVDQLDKDVYDRGYGSKEIIEVNGESIRVLIEGDEYTYNLIDQEDIKDFRSRDFSDLGWITLLFIGLTALSLLVNYGQMLLLHYTGQKIIYKIRNEIFEHIQSLSVQFFNNQPVGKIVTRVTNDTETLNEMYTSVIVNSVKNVLMIIGIAGMMVFLNPRMALLVFSVIPLIFLSAFLFRKFSRKVYRDVRTRVAAINAFLSEHLSGMRIVQIFAREDQVYQKFEKDNNLLKKANLKQLLIFSVFRPSMYFLYILAMAITLFFGGNMVIEGLMSIGVLVMFLQYVSQFFDPIQQLAEQFNILQSAMASAEKIFTLLDDKSIIDDSDEAVEIDEIVGKIEFKNVWFAYDKENWVLRDVSFVVEPGETAAFVGATGAGKTSILNLISRYYEIQKGQILIDDIPIHRIKKQSIRKYVGQMLQDVFVFTGDINSNIRLKDPSITGTEIVEASKYVNAHHFISKLPNGYEEHTYERGATYSTGQRQLLSFARTLAFKPSVLVLDEATANIDTETEILIQDALGKLMEGRTTLVVAHRLSTIQHADKIIVLHKGKIREIGNHQELLAEGGLYYNLYQLQYKDVG